MEINGKKKYENGVYPSALSQSHGAPESRLDFTPRLGCYCCGCKWGALREAFGGLCYSEVRKNGLVQCV